MDNLTALSRLCNAICNTFYPDRGTLELALFNEGINSGKKAKPKDVKIFQIAVALVRGYVESSRTENGISTAIESSKVDKSIAYWCNLYGLDAEDYLISASTIEDGSNLW